MATITPTFSLKSNSHIASGSAGPMSMALALSISDSLAVDLVDHFTISSVRTDINATGFAEDGPYGQLLIDGSDFTASAKSDGSTLVHTGCFLFIMNTTAATSNHVIAIGHTTDADAGSGDGLSEVVDGNNDTYYDVTERLFSLRPQEFAWFPYDYTGDLYAQATGASQSLEFWRFDRV